MGVSASERDKYTRIWQNPAYHAMSPGQQLVPMFQDIIKDHSYRFQGSISVMDIGAGAGAASRALKDAGFDVSAFDLTSEAWDHDDIPLTTGSVWKDLAGPPRLCDYAYCCDMMEHIPPQFVALSVRNILSVAVHGAFFSISFVPDHFGASIGEPLHLTVQPFTWWRDTLREIGNVEEARDLQGEGIFFLTARRDS